MPSISYAIPQASTQHSQSKVKIGSEAWIEQKLRQYPELLWLIESTGAPSISHPIDMVYSEKFFNKKVPALDIAIRSIIHLHLLIQGSRQSYIQVSQIAPTEEGGITFKQFQSAHKQLLFFLNSPKSFDNTLRILETAIVLRHIGCSAKAVSIFKPYFTDSCPETFYTKCLHVLRTFPELCPSYARLSPEQQDILSSLRGLGNYNSLLNLTEVPSTKLLSTWRTRRSLAILDLYLYCLDTCGEKNYSQEFYVNFAPLLLMLQQHATVEEAFSRYFTYRANRLGFEGASRTDMTLVRLATLMNLSPTEATTLAWSFKNLPSEESESLVNSFYTVQGQHIPLTCRGLPSLIAGLSLATHGSTVSPENRLRQVYSTMLSLLVKSLRSHKDMLNKQLLPQNTVLDFSETMSSSGGLDIFSESIAVRIHLNGTVSINL
nr:hypothetical protein [Chlamydia serpentis]